MAAANPPAAMANVVSAVAALDTTPPGASRLLRDFFGAGHPLAGEIGARVTRLDHVGAIAPAGSTLDDAEAALRASGFTAGTRRFRSRILAADLSERLRRSVRVDMVESWSGPDAGLRLGFEWFVADLPPDELELLVREEFGCHVALRLAAGVRTEEIHAIASRASLDPAPTLVTPIRANADIGVELFYLDRTDESGRVRRLELVAET